MQYVLVSVDDNGSVRTGGSIVGGTVGGTVDIVGGNVGSGSPETNVKQWV